MKVLLVDGPWAGRLVEAEDSSYSLVAPVPVEFNPFDPAPAPWDASFNTVVYHFATVVMFGHRMILGTINPSGQPCENATLDLILSDKAKEAVS